MFRRNPARNQSPQRPVENGPASPDDVARLRLAASGIWKFARGQEPGAMVKLSGYDIRFEAVYEQAILTRERRSDILRTTIAPEIGGLTLTTGLLELDGRDDDDRVELLVQDREFLLEGPAFGTLKTYPAVMLGRGEYVRSGDTAEQPLGRLSSYDSELLSGRLENMLIAARSKYGFIPDEASDPSARATLD